MRPLPLTVYRWYMSNSCPLNGGMSTQSLNLQIMPCIEFPLTISFIVQSGHKVLISTGLMKQLALSVLVLWMKIRGKKGNLELNRASFVSLIHATAIPFKGLFTWKWGTPASWGSQCLHIFFVVYLVAFTCVVGYPTQPGNPSPRGGLPAWVG